MSDETTKGWDYEPEYGSDDWASRRGYEIATAYDVSHDSRMAQADEIADELRRLREQAIRASPLAVTIPADHLRTIRAALQTVKSYLSGAIPVANGDVDAALAWLNEQAQDGEWQPKETPLKEENCDL